MSARIGSRLLRLAAALAALVLALGVATAAWLSRHPMSLEFLTPSLEATLSSGESGLRAEIGRTELVWVDWTRGPRIHAFAVRLIGTDGSDLVSLREIEVGLAMRALLRGTIAPDAIELVAPVVHVTRNADGSLAIDLSDAEGPEDSATSPLRNTLDHVLAPPDPARPLSYLEALRIRDGDATFEDRSIGATWRAPEVSLEVRSRDGGLDLAADLVIDFSGRPLRTRASLHYDASSRTTEGTLDLGALRARASAAPDDDTTRVRIEASARDLAVSEVGSYWPPGLADEARSWVVGNIRAGTLPEARFELTAQLGSEEGASLHVDTLQGSARAEGLAVHYLEPLPPATGVDTRFRFDRTRFDFDVGAGRIEALEIPQARVEITGIDADAPHLTVAGHVVGPLSETLRLLDREPLALLEAFRLDPDQAAGSVDGELEVGVPLSGDVDLSRISIRTRADLADVALDGVPGGIRLAAGQLELSADDDGLLLTGHAICNDRPAELTFRDTFRDASGARTLELSARLPNAGRGAPPIEIHAYGQSRDGRLDRLDLRTEADTGERAEAHYSVQGEEVSLEASGASLGTVLDALGVSQRLRGGTLVLVGGRTEPGQPLAGVFDLTNFSLRDTPVLARLLETLSIRGLLEVFQSRKGLQVQQFRGSFAYADGRLTLSDARGVANTLALTVAGDVSIAEATADLHGTVLSMTNVATGLGGIPLLGRALKPKEGGLFGADYEMSGPLADPKVRVSKIPDVMLPEWLSKLTPMPLMRKLRGGDAKPAPP